VLSSVKRLRRYQVAATDARVGLVEDFYIDIENWGVRYLVVEKGMLFWRRSCVIPALGVASVEPHERRLRLRLSKEQVARCSQPDVGQVLSHRAGLPTTLACEAQNNSLDTVSKPSTAQSDMSPMFSSMPGLGEYHDS